MAITFKSVGHFFAKVYQDVIGALPKIEATAGTVEKVTADIPVYGPLAVTVEQAGYAVLGELSAVLNAGGAAVEAKLADAGLDINVINTVKAVVQSVPTIAALAKTL
jgi:hypothetical protein